MAATETTATQRGKAMTYARSYRDLIVWQKAVDLGKRIYVLTRNFPRRESYGLTSQIQRAAVSIAANIAEGQSRETTGEFRQFLGMARGSMAELDTLLLFARDLGYAGAAAVDALSQACEKVGRLLSGLQRSLPSRK